MPDIVLASGVQLRTTIPFLLEMTVCYVGANKTNKQANSIIFYKMLSVGWENRHTWIVGDAGRQGWNSTRDDA